MNDMDRSRLAALSPAGRIRQGVAGLALVCAAPYAVSDVLYEENFSGDDKGFTTDGRVTLNNGYARLHGSFAATSAITSGVIRTQGASNLSLTYTRETFGLDVGESLNVEVSVDGSAFTVVESSRTASGNTTLSLPQADNELRLRFSLNANTYFDRAELRNVVLSGEVDDDDDCGNIACEEPPQDRRTTIVPDRSWDCGMPGGIPDPRSGELLFTALLPTGSVKDLGQTPYGQRSVVNVNGGRLNDTSSDLNGSIQSGALDFNLALPSGAVEHESRYTIRTADGTQIYMRNCGVADGDSIRFVADFEAPNNSAVSWLHDGIYVGVREQTEEGVRLSVYQNPQPGSNDQVVTTPSDNGLRQQSWDCPALPAGADSGNQVLQARVGIGGFQSIGDSKYGSRRIIPITGGSFSGDFAGEVNPGGADYQLTVDGDLSLEARYTLQTSDGETIVVRNCGDYGNSSLTLPLFETSTSGRYAWLNDREFVGTITPGLSSVTITVFDRQ
ncbi:DUF3237 family protein [Pseudomonas sp. gcc21]|uniref:DUF3237 domain-containing protein n=1 Tax=Pseudomonas sp. gcc21 TaxID=2726989 RepID=UPI0014512397|nr:DUF3237 family protein [Pseudomonas sp. gcc21]QJD58644.1 DUF3237 family protein [Pseudomonas sp. gcc21]